MDFRPVNRLVLILACIALPLEAATVIDLGQVAGTKTVGSVINNRGDVAGYAYTDSTNTTYQAMVYSGLTAQITYFGSFGAYPSYSLAINSTGEVAGVATEFLTSITSVPQAFLYPGSGSIINLGQLAIDPITRAAFAKSMNDSGLVVGYSYDGNNQRGFLTTCSSSPCSLMTELGTLGGPSSEADFVNNAGNIAGIANVSSSQTEAFFSKDGTSLDAIVLPLGTSSSVAGINGSGQVVGSSTYGQGLLKQHAFLYTSGTTPVITDIKTLYDFDGSSTAAGINDAGVVIGQSDVAAGQKHAFECMIVGSTCLLTDLGTLNGLAGNSTATDINNLGYVIGTASTATGVDPFVWFAGQMFDLNSFLPADSQFASLTTAVAINDDNIIIGQGTLKGGGSDTYILSLNSADFPQVPEPGTLSLMLVSCAIGCLVVAKRARN